MAPSDSNNFDEDEDDVFIDDDSDDVDVDSEMFDALLGKLEVGYDQFDAEDYDNARKTFCSANLFPWHKIDTSVDLLFGGYYDAKCTCLYFLGLSCIQTGLVQEGVSYLHEIDGSRKINDDRPHDRLRTVAEILIEAGQWEEARYCLQLALSINSGEYGGTGEGVDELAHDISRLFVETCKRTDFYEEAICWMTSRLEHMGWELDPFETGPRSDENNIHCLWFLFPTLGRLLYRVGRSFDCLLCFQWIGSFLDDVPIAENRRPFWYAGWIDMARAGTDSKRWLIGSFSSDTGWHRAQESFLENIGKSVMGWDEEDFIGIGKSCLSQGRYLLKTVKDSLDETDSESLNKTDD